MTRYAIDVVLIASSVISGLVASAGANGQASQCPQVSALLRMVKATTEPALITASNTADQSYKSRLTFAARLAQLRPRDAQAANALLNLLPTSDDEGIEWGSFGDGQCEHESVKEMERLDAFGAELTETAATAVLVVPSKMDAYVAASEFLVGPHSDQVVKMERVCRLRHVEFERAVEALEPKVRDWFRRVVFEPENCRALLLPEGE